MSKTYRAYDPDQQLLLPAALQEWLPDDHLAYFISDVVEQLDRSDITARYEPERRPEPCWRGPGAAETSARRRFRRQRPAAGIAPLAGVTVLAGTLLGHSVGLADGGVQCQTIRAMVNGPSPGPTLAAQA